MAVYNNADKWIEAHRNEFTPPVCTKSMHDGQLKVVYVGGPNLRLDFHIEEGEEFFYMVKGDMRLTICQLEKFSDIHIKEGEVFLLPARLAHSPQRSADTIGLLIERERKPSEVDCIRWYVKDSAEVLYESWSHVENLGSSIAVVIQKYMTSEQYKTGQPAPDFISKPPYVLNNNPFQKPFSLKQWLCENQQEINEKGFKNLFLTEQTEITIYGRGNYDYFTDLSQNFVWQLSGERTFEIGGKRFGLQNADTLLIPSDTSFQSIGSNNCLTFIAKMKPKST